jgi:hypothetical protein
MTIDTPTWIDDGQHESDLGRFVLEGDEFVNHLVSRAVDELCRLTEHKHLSYASAVAAGGPEVLRSAVQALYLHLKQDHHIRYEYERDFIEISGEQRVRLPGTIRQENRGTCLDLALLFASCLANAKLCPIIVVFRGHALTACWTTTPDRSRKTFIGHDELCGHIASGKMAAVECTGFVEGFPERQYKLSFSEACQEGRRLVQELARYEFRFALDIRRAWENGVRPLCMPPVFQPSEESGHTKSTFGREAISSALLDGHWDVVTSFEDVGDEEFDVEITSKGQSVTARATCVKGYDKGHISIVKGTYANLILCATWSSADPTRIDCGTVCLMLLEDGDVLQGFTTYFHITKRVLCVAPQTWRRCKVH